MACDHSSGQRGALTDGPALIRSALSTRPARAPSDSHSTPHRKLSPQMAAPAPTSASVASATPLPSSAAQAASASASASPLSSSESSGVLVVGGGVMGLSVVLQLLRSGYKHVTIIAEKFSPDTTSDGAGASLRPGGDYTAPSPARDRMQRWGEETSSFLFGLRRDLGAQKSGITLASGYEFWGQSCAAVSSLTRHSQLLLALEPTAR